MGREKEREKGRKMAFSGGLGEGGELSEMDAEFLMQVFSLSLSLSLVETTHPFNLNLTSFSLSFFLVFRKLPPWRAKIPQKQWNYLQHILNYSIFFYLVRFSKKKQKRKKNCCY